MTRARVEYVLALLLELIGAAAALIVSGRVWQTVGTPRARPLYDDVLRLSGRSIDSSPTALALVALAGVVAVIATRGFVRRLIGLGILLAGIGLAWRSGVGFEAIGTARARDFVMARHSGVGLDPGVVASVSVHDAWPALSFVAALLVISAGTLVALRGHAWSELSSRYDAPADPAQERARADSSLWQALDRGDDPTTGGQAAGPPGTESDG